MKHVTIAVAVVLMLSLAATSFGQSKPAQTAPTASATAASQPAAKAAIDAKLIQTTAGKTKNVTIEAIKGGFIEVTVLDEGTGKPISNALVTVMVARSPGYGHMTVAGTNDKGIALVRVAPGEYRAHAVATDYGGMVGCTDRPALCVEEGKTAKAEIKLKADPLIKGVVKDTDGNPVAGAALILRVKYDYTHKTDDAGKFSFHYYRSSFDGSGGKVYILARQIKRGLVGTAEIKDPDTELAITMDKGITLKGVVTDANGQPIKGAQVSIYITHGKEEMRLDEEFSTDDKGRYEIPTMPKDTEFIVSATAEGCLQAKSTEVTIDDKTLVASVGKLALLEAKRISGTVQNEDGKGVAGVNVWFTGPDQPIYAPVVTDKDGKFVLTGLVEGHVAINASTPNGDRRGNANVQAGASDVVVTLKQSGGGPAKAAAVGDDKATSKPASAPATKPAHRTIDDF